MSRTKPCPHPLPGWVRAYYVRACTLKLSIFSTLCVPEIARLGNAKPALKNARFASFWSFSTFLGSLESSRWALLSRLMREMIQSSQNLLLEAKEMKMDNFKVRAQTQFSRTQLGSGQGFVLLIKIFRLIPNLGIFMITLHRTPRGRKALD